MHRAIVLLMFYAVGSPVGAQETPDAFVTWSSFEPDKCASIWLIKRFIAPDAEIRFFVRGELAPAGVPFDVPEARFRRYHNRSTYETLHAHYGPVDPRLEYVGRLMHDIEINVWERKALAETERVEAELWRLADDEAPAETVAACIDYFDRLYASLQLDERDEPAR